MQRLRVIIAFLIIFVGATLLFNSAHHQIKFSHLCIPTRVSDDKNLAQTPTIPNSILEFKPYAICIKKSVLLKKVTLLKTTEIFISEVAFRYAKLQPHSSIPLIERTTQVLRI